MKVAILGSGNIGADLMLKIAREPALELVMMAGVDPASEGLALARSRGHATTADGIDGIFAHDDRPELVFDATTARAHLGHAERLADAGIRAIDMTPAAVGPMVIPAVNLAEHLDAPNINMVSCVAQATVPIVHALHRALGEVGYAEIVSTIASRSAGPGTRQNIDEFTHKTRGAIEKLGGARRGKAIVVLNPADPPPLMHNTVYALAEGDIDLDRVRAEVSTVADRVRSYVPGYRFRGPTLNGTKLTVYTEVEGAGDFLPPYAGNLDIMTAAAIAVATAIARRAQPAAATLAPRNGAVTS
ncbi:MAG: acetaldehyde dehydrogenase [Mycobacterium sp.]|jgi:acetaldehyde dehydrogenase (acetylating)|nr:acetaldehyde dehydrogenase [Mycobacterium sp.]